jgi:hypothetical protein
VLLLPPRLRSPGHRGCHAAAYHVVEPNPTRGGGSTWCCPRWRSRGDTRIYAARHKSAYAARRVMPRAVV